MQRAERADAIGDEVRPILRRHDAFAQTLIEKAKQEAGDFRFGPFSANDFDQMQIARRIEEVHAEKVLRENLPSVLRPAGESECRWCLKR